MNAESIARALGGRKAGSDWVALCPAHDDRDPSLSIKDAENGIVLVHCHAGCEQVLVIGELRSLGLWSDTDNNHRPRIGQCQSQAPELRPEQESAERTAAALRLWQSALPAAGTPVETYLRSRGISILSLPSIRFHPRLRHPSGDFWPGLVALVTRGADGLPLAIHRTFICRDGSAKAHIQPNKMMLGPCRGGAVRLAVADKILMVGEGIETCLAAIHAKGLPAWAALSTSGLRTLGLPAEIREVIVLADGDDAGETAALNAARRWKSEGRKVRIARPPDGMDFNDVLLGRQQEGSV